MLITALLLDKDGNIRLNEKNELTFKLVPDNEYEGDFLTELIEGMYIAESRIKLGNVINIKVRTYDFINTDEAILKVLDDSIPSYQLTLNMDEHLKSFNTDDCVLELNLNGPINSFKFLKEPYTVQKFPGNVLECFPNILSSSIGDSAEDFFNILCMNIRDINHTDELYLKFLQNFKNPSGLIVSKNGVITHTAMECDESGLISIMMAACKAGISTLGSSLYLNFCPTMNDASIVNFLGISELIYSGTDTIEDDVEKYFKYNRVSVLHSIK